LGCKRIGLVIHQTGKPSNYDSDVGSFRRCGCILARSDCGDRPHHLQAERYPLEAQKRMVAPNAVSIAEAHFSSTPGFGRSTPTNAGGFVMLFNARRRRSPNRCTSCALHDCRPYQGKGYGAGIADGDRRPQGTGAKSCLPAAGGEPAEGFYRPGSSGMAMYTAMRWVETGNIRLTLSESRERLDSLSISTSDW